MTITYSLDEKSIRAAAKKLEQLNFRKNLDELCRRLSEVAAQELDNRGYNAGSGITVTAEPTEDGYKIMAEGEAVYFLEYGTGNMAGTGEILGTPPVDTTPGSYSEQHADTYRQWWYTGQPAKSDGSYRYEHAPKSGMYFAFQAMRENVQTIAKEIFR